MTNTVRILGVLLLLAAPVLPLAEPRSSATSQDSLTAQQREMLELATEFSRACAEKIEAWMARKETTQERLFAWLYYPVPGTDPVKYTTDWDRLSDRDIQPIEEALLARSPLIQYAVMIDRNGYIPTHNLKYSQPLTGDPAVDLPNNRTKRIWHDLPGLATSRNEAPFLVVQNKRDNGEIVEDLSVPIYVRGVRFGSARIGYRPVVGK